MEVRPPDLSDEDIARALTDGWGLGAVRLNYLPKGFGSHHWVAETAGRRFVATVDDLDHKPWLGEDRDTVFSGLSTTFGTAVALRGERGLAFIVAPIRSEAGDIVRRLAPHYSLALFPFVDGPPGRYGERLEPASRDQRLRRLATLHQAPDPKLGTLVAPAEADRASELDRLIGTMVAGLDDPWTEGPFGEDMRTLLRTHLPKIETWRARNLNLARALRRHVPVITHGEPKADNWIETPDGPCLIDWDTAMISRPERDLWHLEEARPDRFTAYLDAGGEVPDEVALAWYRLAWTLTDLADFVAVFRGPHAGNPDTRTAFDGVRGYLTMESPELF